MYSVLNRELKVNVMLFYRLHVPQAIIEVMDQIHSNAFVYAQTEKEKERKGLYDLVACPLKLGTVCRYIYILVYIYRFCRPRSPACTSITDSKYVKALIISTE